MTISGTDDMTEEEVDTMITDLLASTLGVDADDITVEVDLDSGTVTYR